MCAFVCDSSTESLINFYSLVWSFSIFYFLSLLSLSLFLSFFLSPSPSRQCKGGGGVKRRCSPLGERGAEMDDCSCHRNRTSHTAPPLARPSLAPRTVLEPLVSMNISAGSHFPSTPCAYNKLYILYRRGGGEIFFSFLTAWRHRNSLVSSRIKKHWRGRN